MHINKTLPLALVLAGVTAPALAVEKGETYLGGGFGRSSYEEEGFSKYNPTFGIGRIGYGVTDNFAVEGRLGFGISDDSDTETSSNASADFSFEIDYIAAAYGVIDIPVADTISLYGLLGLASVDVDVKATRSGIKTSESSSETDFSYGVGAEVKLTKGFSGYVEHVQYFDENENGVDYELTGITLGAKYSF